jgi:hypothetical protein
MRPSKINLATAKKTWWVPSSFLYVMFKGTAWSGNEKAIEKFNDTEDNDDRIHETIHVRQAEGMHDSWIRFYWKYIWQWVGNLPLITVKWHAAYKFMPIELEAYKYENNPGYIKKGGVYGWGIIKKKYPLKERKKLAEKWYHGYDEETHCPYRYEMTFNQFLNTFMI